MQWVGPDQLYNWSKAVQRQRFDAQGLINGHWLFKFYQFPPLQASYLLPIHMIRQAAIQRHHSYKVLGFKTKLPVNLTAVAVDWVISVHPLHVNYTTGFELTSWFLNRMHSTGKYSYKSLGLFGHAMGIHQWCQAACIRGHRGWFFQPIRVMTQLDGSTYWQKSQYLVFEFNS